MVVFSLVQLGLIFCNGIQNTLLSWMTSCVASNSFGVERVVACGISMRIYNSCNELEFEDFPVDDSLAVFQSHLYNRSNSNNVFVGLPYLSDINDEENKEIIKALCQRCRFNIIVLDNSCHTNTRNIISYPSTMLQMYIDAKRYATVINRALGLGLLEGEHICGLGYSLGAQTLGHVCRQLQSRCGLLYAFDPAGPFYLPEASGVSGLLPHLRLVSRGDADLVVLVGCNEGVIGTPFRSGDVNLHVNGGTVQPGCQALSMTCSHQFCRKIMLDSISSPRLCRARVCESKTWFDKGLCNYNGLFTLTLPLENRLRFQHHEPINVYMDTLQTDSCQGHYGSVQQTAL